LLGPRVLAIKASLSGGIVYPLERNARTQYLLWLTEVEQIDWRRCADPGLGQRGGQPAREGARLVVEV
jgi:hypothetical protein